MYVVTAEEEVVSLLYTQIQPRNKHALDAVTNLILIAPVIPALVATRPDQLPKKFSRTCALILSVFIRNQDVVAVTLPTEGP